MHHFHLLIVEKMQIFNIRPEQRVSVQFLWTWICFISANELLCCFAAGEEFLLFFQTPDQGDDTLMVREQESGSNTTLITWDLLYSQSELCY